MVMAAIAIQRMRLFYPIRCIHEASTIECGFHMPALTERDTKKILIALLLASLIIGCMNAPEVQKKVAEKDFQQVSTEQKTPSEKQEEVGKTLANVSKNLDELSDLTKELES